MLKGARGVKVVSKSQRKYTGVKVTGPLKEETAAVKEGRRKVRGGEQVVVDIRFIADPLFRNYHSFVLRSPLISRSTYGTLPILSFQAKYTRTNMEGPPLFGSVRRPPP